MKLIAWLARWPHDARGAFWLAAVVGGAAGLLLVPLAHRAGVQSDAEFAGDAHDGYMELARSLVRGDGYVFEPGGDRVSHRPPFYPFLLTPIAALPDALQRPVLTAVHVLFLAATAAGTFGLAGRWFGAGTARIATALLVFNPWILWLTAVPMIPITEMALYVWLVRALFAASPEVRIAAPAVHAGVPAGALLLIHGAMPVTVALLFACAGVVALWRNARSLWPLTAAALLAIACVAPWSVRNWMVFERFIPVATNAGLAYFAGTAHWGQGPLSGRFPPEEITASVAGVEGLLIAGVDEPFEHATHFWGLRDVALAEKLDGLAAQHASEDLPRLGSKIALNGIEFYAPVIFPALRGPLDQPLGTRLIEASGKLARSLFYLALCGLAGLALVLPPAGRRLEVALLGWVVLAYVLPYLPFLAFGAHSMYNAGSLPCLGILAAVGAFAIRDRAQLRSGVAQAGR